MFNKKHIENYLEVNFMNIGKNISALRKKHNLTQEELANKLGVSAQAVSKWENETSCPDISLLTQIADLFGVTVDDLIRNSETDIVLAKENPNGEKREKSILKRKVIVNIRQLNGKENKIKIPLNLVNVGLRIGNSFGLDEVVSSKISEIIETENFGEIVSIDTENGEHITILVE